MPAVDKYTHSFNNITDPSNDAIAVTPSDNTDLSYVTKSLYIGGAGNLKVIMKSGATVTFNGLLVGTTLNIRASRILATGTTATNIIALF
jgi:hypothetical protein